MQEKNNRLLMQERDGNKSFVNKIEELDNMHHFIAKDNKIFKKRNLSENF
jgi:hypothetical protein